MSSEELFSDSGDAMSDPILRIYMNPVIREALVELTLIKSALESSMGYVEREEINDVQSRLRLVTGSLVMLSLSRAANVLHTCHQHISDIGHGAGSGSIYRPRLLLLVEIIDAISTYLDTFLGAGNNQEGLLSAVEDKVLRLDKISAGDTVVEVSMSQSGQSGGNGHDLPAAMDEISPVSLADRERLNVELKSAFLQRAEKNIRAGRMVLEMLGKTRESVVLVNEFRKILGLLGTSALAAGISEVAELCHSMESLVGMLIRHDQPHANEIHDLLTQSYGQLTEIVDQYNHHEAVIPVEDLVLRINKRLMTPLSSVISSSSSRQSTGVDRRRLETRRNLSGRGKKNHIVSGRQNYQQLSGNLRKDRSGQLDMQAFGLADAQPDIGQGYVSLRSRLDGMKKELDRLRVLLRTNETSPAIHKAGTHDHPDAGDNDTLFEYLDESDRLYEMNMQLMNSLAQGMERQQQILASLAIHLSGNLNIGQVLMVQAGKEIYAILKDTVEDVVYIQASEIDAIKLNDHCYHHDGRDYQFRNLGVVLGQYPSACSGQDIAYPVVLMCTGNKYFALQVDQLKGQREIIVNQAALDLNLVKVISGATLLGDGRLVLVLELGALLGEDVGDLKALEQLSSI